MKQPERAAFRIAASHEEGAKHASVDAKVTRARNAVGGVRRGGDEFSIAAFTQALFGPMNAVGADAMRKL